MGDYAFGIGDRDNCQFDGELTRMNRLLHMVVFDIRKYPNVTGILAERITCEPKDRLVPSGKTLRAMEDVFEMPDDPISELQAMCFENRIKHCAERNYLTVVNMIANLPA